MENSLENRLLEESSAGNEVSEWGRKSPVETPGDKLTDPKYRNNSYFKPKAVERWKDGLVYKVLGIEGFKRIMPTSGTWVSELKGWHPVRNAKTKEEGLRKYEPETRTLETTHLIATPILGMVSIPLATGTTTETIAAVAINLLLNAYPIMLQRYNRARIYNALNLD